MLKKKENYKTLDEYIEIAKGEISAYVLVTVVLTIVLTYVGYRLNFYYVLFFALMVLIRIPEKIEVLNNLKIIKNYLEENNLLDKIGKIDFWNDRYYFLTENYFIILRDKKVNVVKYQEIDSIFIEKKINLKSKGSTFEEYLHILTNREEFIILTWTNILVCEDFKDISDYLIKKNPNIKIKEPVTDKKTDIFKVKIK